MACLFKRGKKFWISFRINGKLLQRSLKTDDRRIAREKVTCPHCWSVKISFSAIAIAQTNFFNNKPLPLVSWNKANQQLLQFDNSVKATARAAIEAIEKLHIVREITGKQRDRLYAYDKYMKILDEGTEPL